MPGQDRYGEQLQIQSGIGMSNETVRQAELQRSAAIRRVRLLDCWISALDIEQALTEVSALVRRGHGGYACFANVHTVVSAHTDPRLRDATNQAALVLADGKPLSVVARWRGVREMGQVAGPDILPRLVGTAPWLRHYFYGSTPAVLGDLCQRLHERFPGVQIVGSYSPPFRPLEPAERADIVQQINAIRPDIIWVGLGAPRQEYWMADHWQALKPAILLGVGAAFDIHAGHVPRAPEWMKRLSLEWVYRLLQEPRRLWKRYLVTNSLFLYCLTKDSFNNMLLKRGRQ